MVRRIDTIQTANWQLALGRQGEVVEDLADIGQSIDIILSTPKGSVPGQPLFGSDCHLFVDYPLQEAIPNLIRESIDAIETWEPRAKVEKVTAFLEDAGIHLNIDWRPADGGLAKTTEVIL